MRRFLAFLLYAVILFIFTVLCATYITSRILL